MKDNGLVLEKRAEGRQKSQEEKGLREEERLEKTDRLSKGKRPKCAHKSYSWFSVLRITIL